MEEGFVAVAQVGDLAPGEMKFVAIERERIVLANVEGSFYALRDVCGHRNAPLSRGKLEGYLIECPLHFAHSTSAPAGSWRGRYRPMYRSMRSGSRAVRCT